MTETIRVSLPGFDAGTDTNLDHFALYADTDNVLIKRQSTGSTSLNNSTGTISHNLGYIPFFAVYGNIFNDGNYYVINNQYNAFSVPDSTSGIDGTNLRITNNQPASRNFAYDVFYDDMSQTGTPSITQSTQAIKVTRPGKDGTSTNPNDYIMHSDLNNFKILKSGTTAVTTGPFVTPGSVAHGATVGTPYKYFNFLKMPDNKTMLVGHAVGRSYDNANAIDAYMGSTQMFFEGSTFNGTLAYVIYGQGTGGGSLSGYSLAVSTPGNNVLTTTSPENFNFHSGYNTLKYYFSGSVVMSSITTTTYGTVAHNLGYTPFFVGFVSDPQSVYPGTTYAIVPYYLGSTTIGHPNRDIGAFMYADGTNIYFKAWFDSGAGGTKNFTFYYKIFKNNLGI